MRALAFTVASLVAAGLLGAAAPGAQANRPHSAAPHAALGVDARAVGSFAMLARVTVATNVRGERVGQQLRRTWRIIPTGCNRSVCQILNLDRQRSAGLHDQVSLRRQRRGYYTGTGTFYAALRCRGKVYPRGSQVPYKVTLTVTHVAVVEGIAFAQRIVATYSSPGRLDSTPCPLGLSRDAASYTGTATIPSPPVASFATAISPASASASFLSTSIAGRGGAPLVSVAWQFGDPNSGPANTSIGPNATHVFSAPGIYVVSLTVTDLNGLSSTTTRQVTITGPPHAAFTVTGQGTPGTFLFQDSSVPGAGNSPIVGWQWDFGDPSSGALDSSTAQNPSHTFSAPGNYTVTLTVTAADGLTGQGTQVISYAP